ncbi:Amino acid adenylation domain-containing protein [Frankia canadensis]|uniref:Amino acid adenylation domain-containing protein n=1 Tax=Frankia canadensis TaxID=1836972 RepID=A0A2I2L293_9ACTN|nr:non-ribosomal peptide synthetase [Frankia canadensis]SNQ52031.1 Amino acid adenylation domain-containing protein [Frankia canadensis]SOU59321.1 Amino acid adenylation domain-containing protein [Frankia canadensis]
MTTASTGSRPPGTAGRPVTSDEKESRLADLLAAEYVRPDWGLGVPGSQGTDTHREDLGITDEATVFAAVALVLSHYDRLDRVILGAGGVGPDTSPVALAALPVSDRTRVVDLLERAADLLTRPWPWYDQELAARLSQSDGGGEVSVAVRFGRAAGTGTRTGRPAAEPQAVPPPFPLTLTVSRTDLGSLSSTCSFRRELFHPDMVAQFARHVAAVGRQLAAAAPGAELSSIELLDQEERKRVAALGDPGRTVPDEPRRIDELVAARAAACPVAVAVSHGRDHLTYRQLDESADRLARALRAHGVRSGSRVGVCMDRSPELIATLLAVLRAGAAYVPMDPGYPAERLGYTVEDAEVVLVVTDLKEFPAGPARVIRPEELRAATGRHTASPPAERSADDPAYVIYTSGSTGRPKGVVVTHRNVTALISGTDQDFRFSPSDVWALFHSVAFDMSVWEIWGALTTGGRLVVLPHLVCRSPRELHALLTAERVSVLNQTPSAFAQLLEAERTEPGPLTPRLVTFGGEPLDTRMLLPWFDRHPEAECRMVNLYGITETTVHSTWTTITRDAAAAASRQVGTALPGEYLSVRDSAGRLLPPGVAGEINVGGVGVALGYLNRPELTAERFLPDPDRGGRMYRSGDRGRLLPSGVLEHLGRLDSQVKLRGYRIELDEIRAVLLEDPRVLAAAVVVNRRDPDDPATARLDAYAVLDGVDPAPAGESGAAIRARARRVLPDYMVPSTVTILPALPLTPNGKLDGGRLPRPAPEPDGLKEPETAEGSQPCAASPVGTVRRAWMSIVGIPAGLDDNFFDVGGNSILIGRLVRELEQMGLPRLSLRQAYLNPTIRQTAGLLEKLREFEEKPHN